MTKPADKLPDGEGSMYDCASDEWVIQIFRLVVMGAWLK